MPRKGGCRKLGVPTYLMGRNLLNYGKDRDVVRLVEEMVRIQEHSLTENHPDRLASQHALAGAYRANGQIKDVVKLLEDVVRIQEQNTGGGSS